MNRGWSTKARVGGYTVVETLIFLAVSASMFVTAAVLIGGRQGRAQFANTVRDFEAQLIDIANDVASGYYDANTDLECYVDGARIPGVTTGGQKGQNQPCIFVGRTVALAISAERYDVYTVVGARLAANGKPVSSLSAANPRVFDGEGLKKTTSIAQGATITCVKVGGGPGCQNTAISFISRLNGNLLESSSLGGAGITADLHSSHFASADATGINGGFAPPPVLSGQAVTICLKSGSSNQYAIITVTGASSVSIKSEIGQGDPAAQPLCVP